MAQRRRHFEPGTIYRVLNRAALMQQLLFSDTDLIRFEALNEENHQQIPLPFYTDELMPNRRRVSVHPRDPVEHPMWSPAR